MSYTNIASLLDQDTQVDKFKSVLASTKMETIATAVAQVLEGVLKFRPLIEVIKTHSGKVVFREDRSYFTKVTQTAGEMTEEFNPFTASAPPEGDVLDERNNVTINSKNLKRAWGSLDFDYIGNPALLQIVADLITEFLNQDQLWIKRHRAEKTHFLQNYLDTEKFLNLMVPDMLYEYMQVLGDITLERNAFVNNIAVNRGGITQDEAMSIYRARGMEYENNALSDFWAKREIQIALSMVTNQLTRVVMSLFPAVRAFTERSLSPAHGYDVFFAQVEAGNVLLVKNLGDYRILHWEMNQ